MTLFKAAKQSYNRYFLMLNIINDIMTSEWNAHWEMILARGLRLQNSTEFRLSTKIQAKKPDVGRDQHLLAKQIVYSSHYMISQWPKNDRFPFVSCTNNVMQHIDKLSLPVRYVIEVNTSDTLSLKKSHFFSCNFGLKIGNLVIASLALRQT